MGTAVGVLIGVVVTVFVSRYYFQRSVSKSLGVYGLLNSFVFSGIAADVRNQLNFRFKNREVRELQQLVFLVANDGEKAIRDVIEPLGLAIPKDVEVLDASIVHRFPDNLKADLVLTPANVGSMVTFHFPVLNRREFFVVKLLLSGRLTLSDVEFTLLADDLPRTLSVKPTPSAAIADSGYSVEWGSATCRGFTAILARLVLLLGTSTARGSPGTVPLSVVLIRAIVSISMADNPCSDFDSDFRDPRDSADRDVLNQWPVAMATRPPFPSTTEFERGCVSLPVTGPRSEAQWLGGVAELYKSCRTVRTQRWDGPGSAKETTIE